MIIHIFYGKLIKVAYNTWRRDLTHWQKRNENEHQAPELVPLMDYLFLQYLDILDIKW